MQKNKISIVSAVGSITALIALSAGSAQAQSVTFADEKDAMIFGNSANADTGNSSGLGPGMFAGADGSSNKKRSLMQFDITDNVPAGATITDVKLTLILGQVAGSGGGGNGGAIPTRTLGLYDLLQPWSEGPSGQSGNPPMTSTSIGGNGQGTASQVGDSSWDFSKVTATSPTETGTSWTPGGNFSSTASATETFSQPFTVTPTGTTITAGSQYTFDSTSMITDVQNWLDTPTTNDGWLLRALTGVDSSGDTIDLETTPTSFLGFWTRDGAAANGNPAMAPMLTVTYTLTPEPTIALPAALLACVAGRRRRLRSRSR